MIRLLFKKIYEDDMIGELRKIFYGAASDIGGLRIIKGRDVM